MQASDFSALVPLALVVGGVVWWLKRRGPADAAASVPSVSRGTSTVAGRFERLGWAVTLLAACYGLFVMMDAGMRPDLSAPQYAALAAGVCAKVLVPYVFTRAVQGWRRSAP